MAESLEINETLDEKPAYIMFEDEAEDSQSQEKYLFYIIEVQEENKYELEAIPLVALSA